MNDRYTSRISKEINAKDNKKVEQEA